MEKIDLQEDIPSICAQKLKYRQVDLALVPVAMLTELDHYFIESDYCIGANGAVDSVKLYSNVPLDQIREIILDYQSRSSVALTKILCRHLWKIEPAYQEAKPGFEDQLEEHSANVVIGDRTFSLNGKFKYETDLSASWKELTGLPFVFAAWISNDRLGPAFRHDFNCVLKEGLENIERAIEESVEDLHIPKERAADYLKNRIDYQLDAGKLKAMKLFLDYVRKL